MENVPTTLLEELSYTCDNSPANIFMPIWDEDVKDWDMVLPESSPIFDSSKDEDGFINCVPLLPST